MIVTASRYFREIFSEAVALGINPSKIISQNVVMLPNFTFQKYKILRESKLSIISQNCFGGFLYHRFHLPFLSPTINLNLEFKSFLKMVLNLKEYMGKPIKFYDIKLGVDYDINGERTIMPIYLLGDIKLNMVHYNDFIEAENKWNDRVKRINWANLLIVGFTRSFEEAEVFDSLPYEKKVCFVPFRSHLKSAFYIPFIDNKWKNDNHAFGEHAFGLARGNYPFYDLWDLMLYGKKTPRMDFELM